LTNSAGHIQLLDQNIFLQCVYNAPTTLRPLKLWTPQKTHHMQICYWRLVKYNKVQ